MSLNLSKEAIAVNRFGLGAQSGFEVPGDPHRWLDDQFSQYQVIPDAWASNVDTARRLHVLQEERKSSRSNGRKSQLKEKSELQDEVQEDYRAAVRMRIESALKTNTPFIERLVHFWANHFAVSIDKSLVTGLAGSFELEAIRPHVLGNFFDMLMAVEQHPAMLFYLDQERSIGPNSTLAVKETQRTRDRNVGLNENLAREILELHTMGVRSGYTQQDVTEFARALTGWTVSGLKSPEKEAHEGRNGFLFRPRMHEPGSRHILGKYYDQSNQNQAEAVLRDVSKSDATAHHIATKLARHFAGDTPSSELVERLSKSFLNTGGYLPDIYRALIEAPEVWQPRPVKFKTPWEWLISVLRALDKKSLENIHAPQLLNQLGQPVWKPGSPAGYDDVADSWMAPDALIRRVEVAQRFVNNLGKRIDPQVLADQVLLGCVSGQTRIAIAHAESAVDGLVLLFVSPDFLRR